jgi:hypothetical protein
LEVLSMTQMAGSAVMRHGSFAPNSGDGAMSFSSDEVTYELGVTRLFGDCDIGTNGLSSGWSIPEAAHVWNDGLESVFEVTMRKPRAECLLTFEGEPLLGGDCAQQDILLYVNGFRIAFWRLIEARTHKLSATIEPEQFFCRGERSLAKCTWHLPLSRRPVDLGLGSDTRELAFCFRSFTLEEK